MLGTDSGEATAAAVRKLSLEVARLRTLLVINRTALARVEQMGAPAAGEPAAREPAEAAASGPRGGEGTLGDNNSRDSSAGERRDAAVRRLTRDVAELRKELSDVADSVSDAAVTPPRGRGGDREVVQTVKREVAELRTQLENARKDTAATRSALRRLQEDVDALRKSVVARR